MLSTASLAAMTRAAALLALAASLGSAGSDTQRVVVAQRVAALTGAKAQVVMADGTLQKVFHTVWGPRAAVRLP